MCGLRYLVGKGGKGITSPACVACFAGNYIFRKGVASLTVLIFDNKDFHFWDLKKRTHVHEITGRI